MIFLYKDENSAIVHSAKNILEMNGIDSFIKNEDAQSMGARFGIDNTYLELWLSSEENFELAKSILEKEIINPEQKPAWDCSKCGENNEGSFEVCWNCQSEN